MSLDPVTEAIHAIEAGNPQAAAQLLPLVYQELRRLAAQKLAHEKPGQTLDATALVHEAYMRLVASGSPSGEVVFRGRAHFYAAAAEAMRRILIDNARRKKSLKRGGENHRIEGLEQIEAPSVPTEDLLAIDEALTQLEVEDPEATQLVKLRFYAGLSVEAAGEALNLPRATAYRTWNYAKAWLRMKVGQMDMEGRG